MRLLRLRPYYFRCYGESDWIELNADLVILYGPNGFGKTSLVESIEWLFHGRAKRRERGVEAYGKRDYQNYYRNIHAPDEEPTFVEAEIETDEGKIHKIRRELDNPQDNDTSNTTFVDEAGESFSTVGLDEDPAFDPVIPQHSLQDFIQSRPIDRRNKISAALGLNPLIEFDRALDSTNRRLQRTPPDRVEDAQGEIESVFPKMSESEDQRVIALLEKWRDQDFDPSEDEEKLKRAVQDLLDTQESDWNTLKEKLKARRKEIADRVFDPRPIRPPSNRENLQDSIQESKKEILESELQESKRALSSYLEAAAAEYTSERLSFWEKGLQLQEKDSDECPMCEEPTLDEEKREEIRDRLEKSSEFTEAQENLQDFISDFSRRLRRISGRVDNLFPQFLTSSRRESLVNLFEDSESLQSFLTIHDGSGLASVKTMDYLDDLADSAEEIPDLASDPESVQKAKERLLQMENKLNRAIESICSTAESYAEVYKNLKEELEEVIASDDAVKQVDALLEPFNQWESVKVLAKYHELLDEAREASRNLSDHLQEKQDKRLENRGDEIKQWYSVMNPASKVAPSRLDAGAESLRIYANSFGEELNVAAGLSQCQANTLGLSIHFMRTMAPGSPYRFIVLDDPVQSMDENHFETLSRDVIDKLFENDFQVIVSTHDRNLSNKIWEYHVDADYLYLNIEEIEASGPKIRNEKSLSDDLDRVRDLSKGNESERELAVDRIRKAAEKLIRLICKKKNYPIPDPLQDRRASDKLNHLKGCPGVSSKHVQSLSDTIKFCNKSHHDSPDWSVPKESAIKSHIQKISSYGDLFEVLNL